MTVTGTSAVTALQAAVREFMEGLQSRLGRL
jgi:hypothetical protein